MKAYIITIHRGYNYGSALQAFSLYYFIKNMGIDVKIIDYIPSRMIFSKQFLNLLKNIILFRNIKAYLRALIVLLSNEYIYNKFFKKNIELTKGYYNLVQLKKDLYDGDVYITGSDQVWNSFYNNGIDKAYFLDFAPQKAKLISYAASFGRTELSNNEIEVTKCLLNRYSYISVRENSAKEIIENLICRNCEHVLDPTLLFSKDKWSMICPKIKTKDRYLLIYSVEPNEEYLIKIANMIAKKNNLKIYMTHWGLKKYNGVDKNIFNVSPLKLISYFYNADFIIASSFHGTAFSINLNKDFLTVKPEKFSTRVYSLLESLDLQDRLVDKDFVNIDSLNPINYIEVNKKLGYLREISSKFIKAAIYD